MVLKPLIIATGLLVTHVASSEVIDLRKDQLRESLMLEHIGSTYAQTTWSEESKTVRDDVDVHAIGTATDLPRMHYNATEEEVWLLVSAELTLSNLADLAWNAQDLHIGYPDQLADRALPALGEVKSLPQFAEQMSLALNRQVVYMPESRVLWVLEKVINPNKERLLSHGH